MKKVFFNGAQTDLDPETFESKGELAWDSHQVLLGGAQLPLNAALVKIDQWFVWDDKRVFCNIFSIFRFVPSKKSQRS